MKTKKDAFEKLDGSIFNSLKINEMGKIKGGKMSSSQSGTAPCRWTGSDYIDCGDSDETQDT